MMIENIFILIILAASVFIGIYLFSGDFTLTDNFLKFIILVLIIFLILLILC